MTGDLLKGIGLAIFLILPSRAVLQEKNKKQGFCSIKSSRSTGRLSFYCRAVSNKGIRFTSKGRRRPDGGNCSSAVSSGDAYCLMRSLSVKLYRFVSKDAYSDLSPLRCPEKSRAATSGFRGALLQGWSSLS